MHCFPSIVSLRVAVTVGLTLNWTVFEYLILKISISVDGLKFVKTATKQLIIYNMAEFAVVSVKGLKHTSAVL